MTEKERNTHMDIALLKACRQGDTSKVRQVIRKRRYGSTSEELKIALMYASIDGRENIVKLLMAKGVRADNSYGDTALMESSGGKNARIVRLLLNAGANPNAVGREKDAAWTPLTVAVEMGHSEIVRALLERGARVNSSANRTILIDAARKNNFEIVRLLLEKGAVAKSKEGDSALFEAAANGNARIVRDLLDKGADPNGTIDLGASPIIPALERKYFPVATILAEWGANGNATYEGQRTGLLYAIAANQTQLAKMLLRNRANPNVQDGDEYDTAGETALSLASGKCNMEIVRALLAHGAVVNARSTDGSTALMAAAGAGCIDIVRLLLARGADVSAKDDVDGTAIIYASNGKHHEVVRLLKDSAGKKD